MKESKYTNYHNKIEIINVSTSKYLGIPIHCIQEKNHLPEHFHYIKRALRQEKAYVVNMPPYPFIQVYLFIRDLRIPCL